MNKFVDIKGKGELSIRRIDLGDLKGIEIEIEERNHPEKPRSRYIEERPCSRYIVLEFYGDGYKRVFLYDDHSGEFGEFICDKVDEHLVLEEALFDFHQCCITGELFTPNIKKWAVIAKSIQDGNARR